VSDANLFFPKAISAESGIQFRRQFDPINHATLDPPD